MKRKLHVRRTSSPDFVSRDSTVHVAASLDQLAFSTRCPYRIFSSIPFASAVSFTYARIDAPSAIAFAFVHGRNE
jgi:hypothetical protein